MYKYLQTVFLCASMINLCVAKTVKDRMDVLVTDDGINFRTSLLGYKFFDQPRRGDSWFDKVKREYNSVKLTTDQKYGISAIFRHNRDEVQNIKVFSNSPDQYTQLDDLLMILSEIYLDTTANKDLQSDIVRAINNLDTVVTSFRIVNGVFVPIGKSIPVINGIPIIELWQKISSVQTLESKISESVKICWDFLFPVLKIFGNIRSTIIIDSVLDVLTYMQKAYSVDALLKPIRDQTDISKKLQFISQVMHLIYIAKKSTNTQDTSNLDALYTAANRINQEALRGYLADENFTLYKYRGLYLDKVTYQATEAYTAHPKFAGLTASEKAKASTLYEAMLLVYYGNPTPYRDLKTKQWKHRFDKCADKSEFLTEVDAPMYYSFMYQYNSCYLEFINDPVRLTGNDTLPTCIAIKFGPQRGGEDAIMISLLSNNSRYPVRSMYSLDLTGSEDYSDYHNNLWILLHSDKTDKDPLNMVIRALKHSSAFSGTNNRNQFSRDSTEEKIDDFNPFSTPSILLFGNPVNWLSVS